MKRTMPWYLVRRRMRAACAPTELERWSAAVRAQPWSEAYVFFKHEGEAAGPRLAREYAAASGAGWEASAPAG